MTPADLERFRKILGMLSSAHDGERAAAARKASEFLAAHSLTWSSVSLPVEQPDVLAQRRQAAGVDLRQSSEEALRKAQQAAREQDEIVRRHNAREREKRDALKAAWRERSYGADGNGFETGRK